MRIFSRPTILAAQARFPDAAGGINVWYRIATRARWDSFQAVRQPDSSVSLVGDRLVFNVQGNRLRLIARVDWACGFLFIRFIGTHAEYDRITVAEV